MLEKFGLVMLGVAALIVFSAAACGSNGAPSSTTPASTPTVTFTSSPTQSGQTTLAPTTTSVPSSYAINIAAKAVIGDYLVDGRGRALYYTVSDSPGYSNLPDETLSSWPVFYVSTISVPSALNAADFGVYMRDNNVRQTTFKGYPLYYFFQDKAAGDTLGYKLGGVWFVVNPGNFAP